MSWKSRTAPVAAAEERMGMRRSEISVSTTASGSGTLLRPKSLMAEKISISSEIVHKVIFFTSKITLSTNSDIPEYRDVFFEEKIELK